MPRSEAGTDEYAWNIDWKRSDYYENSPVTHTGRSYGDAGRMRLAAGRWQSYDIIFHRPTFKDGKVDRKARFTVLHNDVLIHDNVELQGGTQWQGKHKISDYNTNHTDKGPIKLQDHGNPVRFRNIWIRELAD